MSDWSRVETAVDRASQAYRNLLDARNDERGGSKALQLKEEAWQVALNERADALREQWVEEKDGWAIMSPEDPSLAHVLQRYYAEMLPVWKARKEEAAAAAKAAAKAAREEEEDD